MKNITKILALITFFALITILLYAGGYTFILVEGRFLWIVYIFIDIYGRLFAYSV